MIDLSEFLNKYQKTAVIECPNNVKRYNPKVSVLVFTYNHVNFISKCLDGILSQITNFCFDIYIGEDESSDGTREVCIQYASKYPDKIRLILHHRINNIKINGFPSGRFNSVYGYLTARGKYIALCE